jgi:hypothetical protein
MPSLLESTLSQHPTVPREIASVRIPDSLLAQKALDLAYRVSPPVVWTHVLRTFVFGALVGRAQNLRYDEELFFLASVLHDLGLTTEFRGTERFEVVGADAAAAFLKNQGVDDERRAIIWDAIALHTSVGIASRKRPGLPLPELHWSAASKSVQRVNGDLNGPVVFFFKIDRYCAIRSEYASARL